MKVNKPSSGSSTNLGSLKSGGGKDAGRAAAARPASDTESVEDIEPGSTFEEIVSNYSGLVSKYDLEQMMQEIDSIGAALGRTGSMAVFARYKALIQEFLKKIVPDLNQMAEKRHRRYVDNKKTYLIAEHIDKKIQELLDTMVKKEKSNINLLATIDDIKGLLLDIVILEGKEE